MNRQFLRFTTLILLCCCVSSAISNELIREFKGSENRTTAEFEVKAPWILDWRAAGDYPGSMALQISLIRSPGGEYLGKITKTNWISNGVRMFNQSGTFRFQVNSSLARWTLRVEQLSEDEAKTYIPKAETMD